jgi:hypothetical protein
MLRRDQRLLRCSLTHLLRRSPDFRQLPGTACARLACLVTVDLLAAYVFQAAIADNLSVASLRPGLLPGTIRTFGHGLGRAATSQLVNRIDRLRLACQPCIFEFPA